MFVRENYLTKLQSFSANNVIKVITGIRRAGKTYILKQFFNNHKKESLFIDMENPLLRKVNNEDSLWEYLQNNNYQKYHKLLFDEIQTVDNWYKVINSLLSTGKFDIYITGSNSKLLSTELSTFLSGRTTEIIVYPFSYKECKSAIKNFTFNDYVKTGGFPTVLLANNNLDFQKSIMHGIYSTVLLKDTIEKHKIRDIDLLQKVLEFSILSSGDIVSANSIKNYFLSENRKTTVDAIMNYLSYLQEGLIIEKCSRLDVKLKKVLSIDEKYYLNDHSFISLFTDDINIFYPKIIENIVYLELKRRGNKNIFIGKIDNLEIDFLVKQDNNIEYIQVSYLMEDDVTFKREIKPLRKLKDPFSRTILTMDQSRLGNYDGIKVKYLPDWLLGKNN